MLAVVMIKHRKVGRYYCQLPTVVIHEQHYVILAFIIMASPSAETKLDVHSFSDC